MREILQKWINENDLPILLKTLGELCEERWRRDNAAYYEAFPDIKRRHTDDEPREARRVWDMASAFGFMLSGDLVRLAARFEENIKLAGLNRAERNALDREAEIKDLERKLEYVRNLEHAPGKDSDTMQSK